jgi:hypothetical protein
MTVTTSKKTICTFVSWDLSQGDSNARINSCGRGQNNPALPPAMEKFQSVLVIEGTAIVRGDVCATAPSITLGTPAEVPLHLVIKEMGASIFCQYCIGVHFFAQHCADIGCYESGGNWHKIMAGSGSSNMSVACFSWVLCAKICFCKF